MYEDLAWDEYLSTGVDPTGGELDVEDVEEETELVDGDWGREPESHICASIEDNM